METEIRKCQSLLNSYDAFILNPNVSVEDILLGTDEYDRFVEMTLSPTILSKRIGKGEAAAIALTLKYSGILASNNFNDVYQYITIYSLDYTTTADMLLDAYKNQTITLNEASDIWKQMVSKKRRLPYATFKEYIEFKSHNP